MGALDALIFGYRYLYSEAAALAQRKKLSFGPAFVLTDDEVNEWTRVDLAASTSEPGRRRVAMVITAVNYQLLATDHTVVSAVNGRTHTLPAAPVNGDEYEVKSATGVSGTIVDGGAHDIAGAATYAQSAGENTVFRYAGTQWEIF